MIHATMGEYGMEGPRERNQGSLPGEDGINAKSWKGKREKEVEGNKITYTEVSWYTE